MALSIWSEYSKSAYIRQLATHQAMVYQALEMMNVYGLPEEQRKATTARFSQARSDLIQAKMELDKLAGTDEEARSALRMYLSVREELSRERNTSDKNS